ncbi:MAG: hypothetical protein ACOYT4_04650 [Nanoarchaeota archaeon]
MVYEDWTQREIAMYKRNHKRELGALYASRGISIDEPANRAKYILEELFQHSLELNDTCMQIAKEKGKPAALKFLEEAVLDKYY